MNNLRNIIRRTTNSIFRRKGVPAPVTRTWSDLAYAFNLRSNLNTGSSNAGLFGVSELQSSDGFHQLEEQCISKAHSLISEATGEERSRKMVEIFDELSDSLCRVADLAEFVRVAHPSKKYAQAAESANASISSLVERLNTDYKLYSSLANAVNNGDKMKTTETDDLVARLFLLDFEQSGIHLPDKDRRTVTQLSDAVLRLGQTFFSNSAVARTIQADVIPKELKHHFQIKDDRIFVGNVIPDSPNPFVREISYRIFFSPDIDQEDILMDLLSKRDHLAQICGFPTYAHRTLRGSTLETPCQVMSFLDKLSDGIRKYADEDFGVMSRMKRRECGDLPLAIWDTFYYTDKVKEDVFKTQASDYAPYFSVGTCMEGLNNLMTQLYGIKFTTEEMSPGESWAPHVVKLAVTHESDGLLGYIYCDFYKRTGKPNQECHFTIQGGRDLPDGSYQLPVVVLLLNFPEPRWPGTPSLLTPRLVENLFHEMGHAMHSMLARTRYQHVTGTRCSTDFAEVPSVLMEYFANDPRVLKTFAKHFRTNEPMSDEMIHRFCASKRVFTASDLQMQILYSVVDQHFHGKHPLVGSTSNVLSTTHKHYYSLPYVENTCWQHRFTHIVGYGAKYYSYLVSKALASCIWQSYFQKDPFDRSAGEKYRRECLSYGGEKPPRKLIADYLMKEPSTELLVESILTEVDSIKLKNHKFIDMAIYNNKNTRANSS